MNFLKLHWKLIVGGIIALIVLIWIGSVTGMNKKLYQMALDNLRTDQSRIVEIQQENEKAYEQELLRLQGELERIKSENQRLKGKASEIQGRRENLIVSSDPDNLVRDLHKLGIRSAIRIRRPNL